MSMPAQRIRPAREQYDKMTDTFFKKRLQRKIKPQKEVLMEKTLQKYHQEQMRQEQVAEKEKEEMQRKEFEAKAQKRKAELNKLQRNAGFMDEWLEKGLKEWRINILKKKQREKEDEKFKLRQAEMTLTMVQKVKHDAKEETYREIMAFEKRIQSPKKKPVDTAANLPSDEEMGLEASPKQSPEKTLSKSLAPKESKYKQVQYNKEREQRRRKMLMDQGKMQRELEAKRREDDLVEKMNRLSRQEQELEYEAWRTSQCKAVIGENRKLREARYRKREDLDTEVAMIREEEALTALKSQLERCEAIEQERAENYTVARKQSKRNANAMACQEFLDLIFDLADEAFKHQQTLDLGELDSRNWREWTQLFVEKLPMAANSPITYSEHDQKLEPANARVDYFELLDYLNSAYQWARAEAGAKPINNFELGNAVRTLIDLSYPPASKPDRPKLPLDVKLKLSIIGYAYGGKKTQARLLCSKHGIAMICVDELIQDALATSEQKPQEEDPEASKKEQKEEDPELQKLGLEIRKDLVEGREVSDQACVKLIMHKLGKLFGFYSKGEYYSMIKSELAKNGIKQPPKLQEEEPHVQEPQQQQFEIKEENQEIVIPIPEMKTEGEPRPQKVKGFILVDFPSTLNQAKLLEEALSGYVCEEDKEVETKDKLLAEASILAEPTPLPPPPKELVPSGLDGVLWLKTTKAECIKRAFGLKKDVKNDTTYHVLYNPPPTSSNDIVEKLQSAPDAELLNAMLTDRHIAFEMAASALTKWMRRFGDEKRGRCLLQEIEILENTEERPIEEVAAESINATHGLISDVVKKILEANNEEEQTFVNRLVEEIQFEEKTAAAKLDFERRSMIYEEELTRHIMEIERKKAEEAAEAERAEKAAKEAKKEAKKEMKKEAKKVAEEAKKPAEEEPRPAEEKKLEPPAPLEIPPLYPEPTKAPALVQIEDTFKPVLLELWKTSSHFYTENVKKNMRLIREQRELMISQMNNVQKDMLTFLEKPQPRQKLIDAYIETYNKFLDDNLDMIEDPETKTEMHQRVEDLCGKLLELVDDLQKTSLIERDSIMKSGWSEYQLESLLVYTQSLMQAEVNRYRCFIKFAEDFHAAKDGKPLQELPEEALFAPIVDGAALPDVEDENGNFPRLDALYQSSMAVVTGETVVFATGAKDPKGKKEVKKEVKKDVGKKKKEEEEKPAEENKELAALIENEKTILKYRLGMIKEFSEKRLKEIRASCKVLYEKLLDWIRVTIKSQREAINQLSIQLREAIEEERKIQKELRMKSFDLIRDEKFLYFVIPPPKLLPGIEAVLDSRFTIAQLWNLVQDLRLITSPSGMIDLGLLIPHFSKKTKLSQLFGRDEGLPKSWYNYSYATYQQIANSLDKSKIGYVNFVQLATYFVLLQTVLPTQKELAEYDMKLSVVAQGEYIAEEDFLNVEAWFDQYEECEQRAHAEKFDRVRMIKELLFAINKNYEKNAVNKKELLKVLGAEGIVGSLDELATKQKKYIDVLFGKP